MLIAWCRCIPQDGDILVAEYNADLESLKQTYQNTWFTAPWLFAEWVRFPPWTSDGWILLADATCMSPWTRVTASLDTHRYRLIRAYFNQKTCWRGFDPFSSQKEEIFKNSGAAIYRVFDRACLLGNNWQDMLLLEIATTMHELESEKAKLEGDPDKLEVLFKEMIQMCLWLVCIFLFVPF